MSDVSFAMAKLAGIRGAVKTILDADASTRARGIRPIESFLADEVEHYFKSALKQLKTLKFELDELYDDFAEFPVEPLVHAGAESPRRYPRAQLERLVRDIDEIFEIRANSELEQPASANAAKAAEARPRRVFITHGRSSDWREVQAYIEKDVALKTMELAQEPNLGRTVIEKLFDGAEQCNSAVIVMTGDDIDEGGQARARENVMHEIGFFQGKYGRSRVCLLHEEGVSIPTNLGGVVYVPFPKGLVSAGFHVLQRELKAIYGM
jgi:predicted nucleotide-binding protein